MPKEQKDIRTFLQDSRRADAKFVGIKKNGNVTKFKLRLSKYLYTLVVSDSAKADKIKSSFPSTLKIVEIDVKAKDE